MSRRKTPVETSPRRFTPSTTREKTLKLGNNCMAAMSGHSFWASAMREKSTGCAAAMAVFGSTEVAEIGKEAGVEDAVVARKEGGTEVGMMLAGGWQRG
jgi:hypothetical protein